MIVIKIDNFISCIFNTIFLAPEALSSVSEENRPKPSGCWFEPAATSEVCSHGLFWIRVSGQTDGGGAFGVQDPN